MKKYILIFLLINTYLGAITLQNVSNNVANQNQIVSFSFDAVSSAIPKLFVAGNDLIVDFKNISTLTNQNSYTFESGFVREVDLVTVGSRTRTVIVGGAKYKYQINQNANLINISFTNSVGQSSIGRENVGLIGLPKKSASNYNTQINDIKFTRDDNGGGVVEIPYTGDSKIDVKEERLGENLKLTLNAVGFNSSIIKRIDTTDFDTPIKYIDTKSGNNKLFLTIVNRNQWDYALYQLQNKLIINIRKVTPSDSSIPTLSDSKSDKVTFNFQNIDVRALLQLLSDFSGYNILVSDSVTGSMSIKLNNVPWDQALQIILTTKGLGMRRDGNVIRIAPVGELDTMNKLQQEGRKTQEATEPLDTVTIRLKYSQAATIQSMIQQKGSGSAGSSSDSNGSVSTGSSSGPGGSSTKLAQGNNANSLLSFRGSILVDTRTNTIIINDTPSHLKDIRDLIDKIDIPVKQVLIEARIVEANSNFEKDLGMRLLLAGIGGSLTYSNTLENGVTINQTGINAVSANPAGFVNQNFGLAGGASMSTIFAPNSNTLIGLEVDALELQSQGRTISSPKVMTANYQAANIQQGVQIPYQQATSAGNTNVAFVNATLSLQVTPQITDDGYVLLNVNVQKDSPNTKLQVQGTPSIDTNSVNTQVRVKDGSTILVGGIYVDDQQKIEEQIPLLGDIPYLGWLFKSQSTKTSKKELLIFITPRIISSSLDNDN
jgi:type IV pilus assembly protein PilQ